MESDNGGPHVRELLQSSLEQWPPHDVGLPEAENAEHLDQGSPGWVASLARDEIAVANSRDIRAWNAASRGGGTSSTYRIQH